MGIGTIDSGSAAPNGLPAGAESAIVDERLATFPDAGAAPAIAVFTRADGGKLTPADGVAAAAAVDRMKAVNRGVTDPTAPGAPTGPAVIPSEDGLAAIGTVNVTTTMTGLDLTALVGQVRSAAKQGLPAGLTVQVTGGPAFGADIASAFDGADIRLLGATALVVAVLLLLTYRSPILWLVPLLVVGLADRLSSIVATWVGAAVGIPLDGSTTGITSVLVFGAGTNYALLLVSRYREELRREKDHRAALARAVRFAGPAILASNLTVVLAVASLLLAVTPNNHALGMSAAVGLLVALVFVMFLLPPALALTGRGLFWPFIPRAGDDKPVERTVWYRVAKTVRHHPAVTLLATVPVLLVCMAGLLGTQIGLSQTEQFRVKAESAAGFETLSQHYSAGLSNPTTVVAATPQAGAVLAAITGTSGVVQAAPTGASDAGLTRFRVVLDADPATERSHEIVDALRASVHSVAGADALVGGPDARSLDAADALSRDQMVIIPVILAIVFLVLVALLRSAVAPVLLLLATVLSSFAALGAGAWLSTHVLGFPGLDNSVPLFAVLFLVALGVDYTIFLVTRAREETPDHGTREGIVRAVGLTGGVITSAGIVLAAVFAVLGVLPLITLTQLGIVVGFGILLDTFVVRTIVVPALFSLTGPAVWWPSALGRNLTDTGRRALRP